VSWMAWRNECIAEILPTELAQPDLGKRLT
jgi:hypothetical protein